MHDKVPVLYHLMASKVINLLPGYHRDLAERESKL